MAEKHGVYSFTLITSVKLQSSRTDDLKKSLFTKCHLNGNFSGGIVISNIGPLKFPYCITDRRASGNKVNHDQTSLSLIRPRDYKTSFILNSVEQEILNAHKYKNIKKFSFF